MRHQLAFLVVLVACSHQTGIGPDDGGSDSALIDGALADGALPDGGNAQNSDGITGGSRIKVVYYVGSDGSQEPLNFVDTQRNNETCSYQTAGDSVVRCLPSAVAIANYFGDAACTIAVAITPTTCPQTYVSQSTTTGTCSTETIAVQIYAAGTSFPGSSLYTKSANNCVSLGSGFATWTGYALGAEIPPTSFQDATMVVK